MNNTWSFVKHLSNHMARPWDNEAKHPTLWPSEASAVIQMPTGSTRVVGKCRRAGFFRLLKSSVDFYTEKYSHWKYFVKRVDQEKIPIEDYTRWLWAQGELYEQYVIDKAKESGIYVSEQSRIYVKEYNISGSIDVIVFNPLTGKYSIVEVKSVYGHGGDAVLGSRSDRMNGMMGQPRDSNLMQIALYDWHKRFKNPDSNFEYSRLLYGSRDTGKFAEYLIRTVQHETTDDICIEWKWHAPYTGDWVRSPITINAILEAYKDQQNNIDFGTIPDRDFNIKFTRDQLIDAYHNQSLTADHMEQMGKYLARQEYNAWLEELRTMPDDELIKAAESRRDELTKAITDRLDSWETDNDRKRQTTLRKLKEIKPKKDYVLPDRGDWQCRLCKHRNTCYDENGNPKDVSI